MNSTIKELLEQATTSIKDEYGHWIGSELDEEKFAKMIVQECININREELSFIAFDVLHNRYHEHFGIKE